MGEVLQKKIELSESEFGEYLANIKDDMYQYLLLIAVSKARAVSNNGIREDQEKVARL